MMFIFTNKAYTLLALGLFIAFGSAQAGGDHGDAHNNHGSVEMSIGKPGVATKATRTVVVEMGDDMRFKPSAIQVKRGETIKLVVKNLGKIKHELNLGTQKELLEHLEVMKKYPDMEHDEPNKVTVAPGKQGEIVWQFTKAGKVDFACLVPGHYEAGMKGVVTVGKK